jgi:hypothetical protein
MLSKFAQTMGHHHQVKLPIRAACLRAPGNNTHFANQASRIFGRLFLSAAFLV